MLKITSNTGPLSVTAWRGDAKTLLAFDLKTPESRRGLAGFSIHVQPPLGDGYYLWNDLAFEKPAIHAQVAGEPPYSTANAPIHKFRWLHVPGLDHQGLNPPFGDYAYTVTPRYFSADHKMLPIDPTLAATVTVAVAPYSSGKLSLGVTRGFVQSQAFVRHFGPHLPTRPQGAPLNFDTSKVAGKNPQGHEFTYAQQYDWLGYTARTRIFEILDAVVADQSLSLDVFAYDLNEPDVIDRLLTLGAQGRVRIILDNADLHHDKTPPAPPKSPKPEDQFETLFAATGAAARIKRCHFGRYAHDKVFIVYRGDTPLRVLTGSTNFSVTGVYVNANHVLVIDDETVAAEYAAVFKAVWAGPASGVSFAKNTLAGQGFGFGGTPDLPDMKIAFSPHQPAIAQQVLDGIVARCQQEAAAPAHDGSVFFAVMELDGGAANPVYGALSTLHQNQSLFSYGISDNPSGISYYPVGSATGVLVTGKPVRTRLPPPFSQVPNIGLGHQIHHKFIVCGFNGPDPVVWCGSSNLALMGEQVNGDNLLEIHDAGVATVFVIEALSLIDHFNFLDHTAQGPAAKAKPAPATPLAAAPAVQRDAAKAAGWFLGTTDAWVAKFFNPKDLHSRDRVMFA